MANAEAVKFLGDETVPLDVRQQYAQAANLPMPGESKPDDLSLRALGKGALQIPETLYNTGATLFNTLHNAPEIMSPMSVPTENPFHAIPKLPDNNLVQGEVSRGYARQTPDMELPISKETDRLVPPKFEKKYPMDTLPWEVGGGFAFPALTRPLKYLGPGGEAAANLLDPISAGVDAIPNAASGLGRIMRSGAIGAGLGGYFTGAEGLKNNGKFDLGNSVPGIMGGAVLGGAGQSIAEGSIPLLQGLYNKFYDTLHPWTYSAKETPVGAPQLAGTPKEGVPYAEGQVVDEATPPNKQVTTQNTAVKPWIDNTPPPENGPPVLKGSVSEEVPFEGGTPASDLAGFAQRTHDFFEKQKAGTVTEQDLRDLYNHYQDMLSKGHSEETLDNLREAVLKTMEQNQGGSQTGPTGK